MSPPVLRPSTRAACDRAFDDRPPHAMAVYSRREYWDERYRATGDDGHYEWYQGYTSLRHLLNPIHFAAQTAMSMNFAGPGYNGCSFPTRDGCRVLILGCGNSKFGEDMQRDGWSGPIVNVDFSSVVIDQMQRKYSDQFYRDWTARGHTYPTKMEFICADITERLPFDDYSFDLIVCKGSFDAILCSPGSKLTIVRLVKECYRLLAPGYGIFFLVTHGNPDSRIEFLEHENSLDYFWHNVSVHHVTRQKQHGHRSDYVYVCRKRPTSTDEAEEHVENVDAVPASHSKYSENHDS